MPPEQQTEGNNNQHLNVGMVLLKDEGVDPTFARERRKNADVTRAWAKFFYPGNPTLPQVSIPVEWASFFTVMLMALGTFYWAKELLTSKAVQHLEGNYGLIDFSLPRCCPFDTRFICHSVEEKEKKTSLTIEEIVVVQDAGSSPKTVNKKRISKRKTPLVDNEVKRSPRFQMNNNGSKPIGFPNKKCLACSPSTPTLSSKAIRNLGVQLCEMDPEALDDGALKKKKRRPVW